MINAVVVVDMLRGFLEAGNPLFCGEDARRTIPNIQTLLTVESKKGSRIFFIADCHAPDDAEFKTFPPHCVAGTAETEIIYELKKWATHPVIAKSRYSSFFDTPLDSELKLLKPERVIVVGVCTDICVLHTVADARNRDYNVEVPADCVASFDAQEHEWALRHMEKILGAKITREAA
jgi:nicotinamidase/pyrazinamidase